MASRDVRVRVRPTVVRVRVSEPAIRTVVGVAAENPQLKYPYAYLPKGCRLFELSLEALSGLNRLGYRTPRRFIVIPPNFPRHKDFSLIVYFDSARNVFDTSLILP